MGLVLGRVDVGTRRRDTLQDAEMHSRMQGHGGTRGQTAPSSAAGTGTHLLLPFSFVTHPAGPSTENVKLPATSLPRRMLLTAYVPRRKPVDTQSSSKINISFLLLELSHCAGHPGGTWPWEPARFGSKTPQKGWRCAHPTPVTLPKIPGMGSWGREARGRGCSSPLSLLAGGLVPQLWVCLPAGTGLLCGTILGQIALGEVPARRPLCLAVSLLSLGWEQQALIQTLEKGLS